MKAAQRQHTRSLSHPPTVHAPGFWTPKLPSTRQVQNALHLTLALVLFGTALWYLVWRGEQNRALPTAAPEARLELILSGALTGSLSLGEAELRSVRCDASSFQAASPREAVFPLELAFTGVAAERAGKRLGKASAASYYVLGSRNELILRVDETSYTLLSGAVTPAPGAWRFSASFVDALSQPLQLSGRLVCP